MARITGVDLPRDKRIEIGLTYIYGIGLKSSKDILAKANVNPDIRVKDLSEEDAGKIRKVIENDYIVEGDLKRDVPQHQETDGDRKLQRHQTQKRSSSKRTENQDER